MGNQCFQNKDIEDGLKGEIIVSNNILDTRKVKSSQQIDEKKQSVYSIKSENQLVDSFNINKSSTTDRLTFFQQNSHFCSKLDQPNEKSLATSRVKSFQKNSNFNSKVNQDNDENDQLQNLSFSNINSNQKNFFWRDSKIKLKNVSKNQIIFQKNITC